MIWLTLFALAVLTLFATLNLALQSASRSQLAERIEVRFGANAVDHFLKNRAHYALSAALFRSGANVLVTVSVLFDLKALSSNFAGSHIVGASLFALILILLFGAAIPHVWAKHAGPSLVVMLQPALMFARFVCFPLLFVADAIDPLMRRLADAPPQDAQSVANQFEREILNTVSEGELLGAVDEEEKEMIESVMELGDKRVEQIMTPRTDVVAVPAESTLQTILETIRTRGHSRIPLFHETVDSIVGIIYAKDLLQVDDSKPFDATKIMRKAIFVPESKHVRDLLREFREKKVHIAIVLDEYGGTAGLATIEDILEELVGEISDEFETAAPESIKRINDDTVEVDAKLRIDELNDELKTSLPEGNDYETVGGFVFNTLGKIPKVGEVCEHASMNIQVIGAEPHRITRLRLTLRRSPEEQPAETS